MFRILKARAKQGHRTTKYPAGPAPALPARFAGLPEIDAARCKAGCRSCAGGCPTGAIRFGVGQASPSIDMGRCLFCRECEGCCPERAIRFTQEYRLASSSREGLVVPAGLARKLPGIEPAPGIFRRSLKLRQVCAGGCNACEADINVLGTIGWDLGRFGIQFVASPRHADGILVTGPVTANMREALLKTWSAVPSPKVLIAVGICAISGGLYEGRGEVSDGVDKLLPVDLYIPGCPPHPLTILDGLLSFQRPGRHPRRTEPRTGPE
jgi:Ni,Fe-hydrogenase III small subunit/NAD-dependent dihydropyrimidine dehydrogenase PreA subunit